MKTLDSPFCVSDSEPLYGEDTGRLSRAEFKRKFNSCFKSGEFFFFLIDYEQTYFDLISGPPDDGEYSENRVCFSTPEWATPSPVLSMPETVVFDKYPISYSEYSDQFQKVMEEIQRGNTYLLNLTAETPVDTNLTLEQIYVLSGLGQIPYRLNYQDRFVSFSPETFVRVADGTITAFPMKGTYTSKEEAVAATEKMNVKELSEQTTVVDRVRNDLSRVCSQVRVEDFITLQEVNTHRGKIYQTISRVIGELGDSFSRDPAGAILELLPAASVTGAPRDSTTTIIKKIETHHRNFYTGIWGVCHEGKLESAVIIRYLEKRGSQMFYKSGGGITHMSQVDTEYQEMTDKVYLPFKLPVQVSK